MISSKFSFISNALRRRVSLVFAVFIICQCAQVMAEEDAASGTSQEQRQGTATQSNDQELKCSHGCLRWGKFCNVDPRGVYKCRRRCEKFGEICE